MSINSCFSSRDILKFVKAILEGIIIFLLSGSDESDTDIANPDIKKSMIGISSNRVFFVSDFQGPSNPIPI